MSTTTDTEVEGSIVHVIHVDDTDTEPVRTVLALATKDDLDISIDEDDEDFDLASERRTRRYRTNNTVDLEVTSVIDVDMEAAELVGIVDAEGKLDFSKEARKIDGDEYVEIAYFDSENADYIDAELVHRFEDLELTGPEVNPSETPPLLSWTWMVEGDVHLAYDEA